jgi:hypothetical protein
VERLKQTVKTAVGSVQKLADSKGALKKASEKSCCLSQIVRTMKEKERENQNTYFMLNNSFRKSCPLGDNVKKCCRAGQATDDNIAHAHCMPDT